MKLYPYSNLTSKNLKLFLLTARLLALLGIILIILGAIFLLSSLFGSDSLNFSITKAYSSKLAPILLKWGFVSLFFSGISAAIVSIEYEYTNDR